MKKRFTDGRIVGIFRKAGCRNKQVKDLRKRQNISKQTFYRWRNKFGSMDVADARRLKDLESVNEPRKRLIAEQLVAEKMSAPTEPARSTGNPDSAGVLAKACCYLGPSRHVATCTLKQPEKDRGLCERDW